jgi:hypothetical protein
VLNSALKVENGMIHHPLVIFPFWHESMEEHANKMYAYKTQAIEEAKKEKNWGKVIFMHERPYRLKAFLDIEQDVSDKDYWKELGNVWIDSESPGINKQVWKMLFNSQRADKSSLMTESEHKELAMLNDNLIIYRGAEPKYKTGISWTTDKEKAEWFAQRFGNKGKVYTRKVRKEQVVGYFTRRGESEVVYHA